MAQLATAAADPATGDAALEALVTVRDLQPASQQVLPTELRGPIRRRVWAARWRRNQHRILRATLRGLQGGFLGLGLGMGLFLGLIGLHASGFDRLSVQATVSGMSVGVPLAGLVGMLTAGSGAFGLVVLRSLEDAEQPLRSWAVATVLSALVMALGFVALGQVFSGALAPVRTVAAGLLIGLGLAWPATVPLRLDWPVRLGLAVLAGMATFVLAWALGLIFNHSFWWLLVMGGVGGAGFCWALNPDLGRRASA